MDRQLLQAQKFPRIANWYLGRQLKKLRAGSASAGAQQFKNFAAIDQAFAALSLTMEPLPVCIRRSTREHDPKPKEDKARRNIRVFGRQGNFERQMRH